MKPFVTVVVPVYGEIDTIEKCIVSLLNQSYQNMEIIVVNDETPGGEHKIIRRILSKYPIRLYNRRGRGGVSSARNFGLRFGDGDIIAYTDADCVASARWVEYLVKWYKDPKVGGVGGVIKPPREISLFQHYVSALNLPNPSYCKNEVFSIPASNASYRRCALEEIGGWNEDIIWGGEDIDINIRLRKKGYKLIVEPRAIVYHMPKRSPMKFIRWRYESGKHTARIFLKYPREIGLKTLENAFKTVRKYAITFPLTLLIIWITWVLSNCSIGQFPRSVDKYVYGAFLSSGALLKAMGILTEVRRKRHEIY